MKLSNLYRAKEIADMMPLLEKARKMLSNKENDVQIVSENESITLPKMLSYNILNVLNCEYERLRKEVEQL